MVASDNPFNDPALAVFLAVFFVALWLAITSLLGRMAGWFRLQDAFPDRTDQPLRRMRFQSGAMGSFLGLPVNYGNCLRFGICSRGLRVSVARIIGPFQRPFFVPWSSMKIRRHRMMFGRYFRLAFGEPEVGGLIVSRRTAVRLAKESPLELPRD